ncbi:hypothetical protein BpHYR1_035939 [Brachionus plicatilis]|uniref:Uncharacterized protein n=1 Tax=Brachionus plicatilis TaxID=10195 RepID=A0A3M7QRR5_BRAPC|nr:hypothetical protein BpHYR1_035939 [Brachionus plicatilis]
MFDSENEFRHGKDFLFNRELQRCFISSTIGVKVNFESNYTNHTWRELFEIQLCQFLRRLQMQSSVCKCLGSPNIIKQNV